MDSSLKIVAVDKINNLREELRQFKREERMTYESLAEYFEISKNTLIEFLGGSVPRGLSLVLISTALGVEL